MPKIELVNWVAVFAGMVILDFLWATYVTALRDDRAIRAGFMAASLYVVGGLVTISFVGDHWLLVPAFCGAFVGTWSGSQYSKRKAK